MFEIKSEPVSSFCITLTTVHCTGGRPQLAPYCLTPNPGHVLAKLLGAQAVSSLAASCDGKTSAAGGDLVKCSRK